MTTHSSYTQLAYVVRDAERAARQWIATVGAGPFYCIEPKNVDRVYRGQPGHDTYIAMMGFVGCANIEFIQPTNDAPSIWRESLSARGSGGFQHVYPKMKTLDTIGFDVECERYSRLGLVAAATMTIPGVGRSAFFDACDTLGCFVEVLEMSSGLLRAVERMHEAHVAWDGSDPYRALTDLFDGGV